MFVVEELEPAIETEIRAAGIDVDGKAFFPRVGEFSPEVVRAGFEHAGVLEARAKRSRPGRCSRRRVRRCCVRAARIP